MVATVRRKDDRFKHLTGEEALYLVWIPEVWLEGDGWKGLVPSHLHALTEHAHEIHYKRHYVMQCIRNGVETCCDGLKFTQQLRVHCERTYQQGELLVHSIADGKSFYEPV
jgi:hypothetical protein